MGNYSIKELEQLSGIKAHTIRIWEKRYSIITPQRTDTNIRFYSDDDLKKIINVSLLNSNGVKISKIAEMPAEEIVQKVLELSKTKDDYSIHINQLILAMVHLDEEKFETALSGFFLRYNFEQTMTEIVYPFLAKTGVLWQTHNITPAQEHFISNLIRQKVIVGIDGLPLQTDSTRSALLFLPEHELHEIGLLFYHYLFRKAGLRTIYLGQAVPHSDLKQVYDQYRPDVLVTSLTTALPRIKTHEYLQLLATDFPCKHILVSGLQVQDVGDQGSAAGVTIFKNVEQLRQLLDEV
jgi:DNA-binding transcriptional MerR regulator